jgi:UDP-N-acetylenolpyruvoylglucosamine reductase
MAKKSKGNSTVDLHWTEELENLEGVNVHQDHQLHMHTPLRVGGPVDAWVRCQTIDGLRKAMPIIRKQAWKVHWPFEDWLVKDGGLNGVVLRLEGDFERIRRVEHGIELGAAALWSNLKGLSDIPTELQHWSGSVGAALMSDHADKLFAGFEIEVEWLRGRHKHRRFFDHQTPLEIPDNTLPLFVRLFNVRRPRKLVPTKNGHVFHLDKKQSPATTLAELNLQAVRLRTWKVCERNPNIIVHLGKGEIEDLKLLQKALNQRLQPARNTKLAFTIPIIGRKS